MEHVAERPDGRLRLLESFEPGLPSLGLELESWKWFLVPLLKKMALCFLNQFALLSRT